MVKNGPGEDDIEAGVGEGQPFGEILYHGDRQSRLLRQRPDRAGTDEIAAIGLQGCDGKSVPGERVARDAASGTDIQGHPRRGQHPANPLPLAASPITLGGADQGIVIVGVMDERLAIRLRTQPAHRFIPSRELRGLVASAHRPKARESRRAGLPPTMQ